MVMLYPAIWWGWSPPIRFIPFARDPLGNLGMFLIPGVREGRQYMERAPWLAFWPGIFLISCGVAGSRCPLPSVIRLLSQS